MPRFRTARAVDNKGMSQQGERPATEDDWWNRLYDESAADTGPAARAGDTLDDRFDSASDTVTDPQPDHPGDRLAGSSPEPPGRPRAWWETPPPDDPDLPSDPAPVPAARAEPEPSAASAPVRPTAPAPPPRPERRAAARAESESPVPDRAAPEPPAAPAPGPAPLPLPPTPPLERSDGGADPEPPLAPVSLVPERAVPVTPRPRAPWEPRAAADPDHPHAFPPGPPRHAPPPAGQYAPPHPPATAPPARVADPAPVPDPGPAAPPGVPDPRAAVVPDPGAAPDQELADEPQPQAQPAPPPAADRPVVGYVGGGPPTYDPEPTTLPPAHPQELDELVPDTVLDGARYGTYTLRAVSLRGDSARYRGEPRRDALLTARFGTGDAALVLVAVASGARAAEGAHLAAADACRWIGGAVGRSHARLSEDIRAGRRGDLKSGLQRLTDRTFGKLRARAAELGVEPEEYAASLRCLLLSADPDCRTRVFFGVGGGGLFRLRDGAWQDIEPLAPESAAVTGAPVVGFGSAPSETPAGDRLTMDLGIPLPPPPFIEAPPPPPAEPFRFRASVARPGDTLLLCSSGLAEPLRGEPDLAKELAGRWEPSSPTGGAPGLAAFLADIQLRVKGYADDRTAVAVWEA